MMTGELTPYGIKVVGSGRTTAAEMSAFKDDLDALSLRAKQNWRLLVDARDHVVMGQDVFEVLAHRPIKVPAAAVAYVCRDATLTMQVGRLLRGRGVPENRMLVINASVEPAVDAKVEAFLNAPLV